jgi:hypothetical protein
MAIAQFKNLLDSLNADQKSLVEEYYAIMTSCFIPDDAAEGRIHAIWEIAANDSILCKHLELADNLLVDYSEEATENDIDRLTYLAEYIIPEMQAKFDRKDECSYKDEFLHSLYQKCQELYIWYVQCPEENHIVPVHFSDKIKFENERCNYCESPFSNHIWTLIPKATICP